MFYSRTGWDAGEQRAFELVKIANYLIRVHAVARTNGALGHAQNRLGDFSRARCPAATDFVLREASRYFAAG